MLPYVKNFINLAQGSLCFYMALDMEVHTIFVIELWTISKRVEQVTFQEKETDTTKTGIILNVI